MPNENAYPIDHWSQSSLLMFLRNQLGFKKTYILKIYDFKSSPAAIVGQSCHQALEQYYKGLSPEEAATIALNNINHIDDENVKWGKTGSREKVIKDFTYGFNGYLEEVEKPFKILGVEKSITAFIEHNGIKLALPAKCKLDLITENEEGEIEITDHKFVTSYTDSEAEKGAFIIQAMFSYFTVLAEFGRAPKRIKFNEFKLSKNSNGDSQLQPYVIEYDKHAKDFTTFIELYNTVTKVISDPNHLYLPNLQDKFDYDGQTFTDYKSQIITVESPIVVQHKTGDFQFKEKNFISSPVNLVDNKYLTEEEKIRVKLLEFGISVQMEKTYEGSSIIQYTMKASRGVKMSQFDKYSADLALALKSKSIRVLAPIMGTDLVGVEVPNPNRKSVNFFNEDLTINDKITITPGSTEIPIGVDVYGGVVSKELSEMPHLLIAGATGQGKSVMINVCVRALAEQNTADELKFVMIDPKRVELVQFKDLPNLIPPIIYETDKAKKALYWLIDIMEKRYEMFEQNSVRDINDYKKNVAPLHRIVVVIDEAADLILQGREKSEGNSTEQAIIRLAQKGRAAGIHLIIGTQRPSVDVISGLMKANFPTRIALTTSSEADSRVILDQNGAEELVGKGDMLFLDPRVRGLQRLQGFYV